MSKKIPRWLAISDGLRLEGWAAAGAWLEGLAAAGVDAVQLREKTLDDAELYELARRLRSALPASVAVLVNGRLDVALAAGCDGVHLPADGVPVAELRRRFGAAPLIGCSTHNPEEVAAARRDGADYACFGPVFATPSKLGLGEPPGIEGLRQAVATGLPVLALGGVDAGRLPQVAAAGAAGAAGIRVFQDPAALRELVAAGRSVWPC